MTTSGMDELPRFLGLVAGIAATLLLGCRPEPRQALEGTVTFDDRPLESGYIQFHPLEGTAGPAAGSEVVQGRFMVPRFQGPFPGQFRIEITASRKTERRVKSDNPAADPIVYEQYIPRCYNQQSSLTAEVKTGGPNRFAFALTAADPEPTRPDR